METSPRYIEYPVENTKETEEAPEINAVALINTDNTNNPTDTITQHGTTFETLCTQLPTSIKIEELHFEYQ
jgi:hypothetical protein